MSLNLTVNKNCEIEFNKFIRKQGVSTIVDLIKFGTKVSQNIINENQLVACLTELKCRQTEEAENALQSLFLYLLINLDNRYFSRNKIFKLYCDYNSFTIENLNNIVSNVRSFINIVFPGEYKKTKGLKAFLGESFGVLDFQYSNNKILDSINSKLEEVCQFEHKAYNVNEQVCHNNSVENDEDFSLWSYYKEELEDDYEGYDNGDHEDDEYVWSWNNDDEF